MTSGGNVKIALAAIRSAKWRSFLTMLGVVVGVISVVTIVSLGEGVKHQLSSEINRTGPDLITIRGGQVANRDASGKITHVNLLTLLGGGNLNDSDLQAVQKAHGIKLLAPFAVVNGVPQADANHRDENINIIATNEEGAQALGQPILFGSFFEKNDNQSAAAVIGKHVAENLFRANAPIGQSFDLRGQKFIVRGVFDQFGASPLNPTLDYNNTIFIPYDFAKQLTGGTIQPYQILVRAAANQSPDVLAKEITTQLQTARGGQIDFTVLQAADNVAVANNVLNLLTSVVSAIAAVSLLVGGIGIMNIMLVAVSERTHEIGVRKSVGATNRQILGQFLTEAVVLSATGGVLGVLLAMLANYLLRVFTSLQPVITLPIMLIAFLVAIVVGVFFGIMPALQAAHKDPIEALRRV